MFLFFVIVIAAVLAYLYIHGTKAKNAENCKEVVIDNTAAGVTYTEPPAAAAREDSFAAVDENQPYKLLNYLEPLLRTNRNDTLKGTNKLVVWDSKRVNTLRREYNVKNVLQRLEFVDETNGNTIEVYRAVTETGLDTFVFPERDADETVILLERERSLDDPSETRSTQKIPMDKMNVFLSDESTIPAELVPMIRDLESSYKARQASSGPKAVDTHRS